MNAIDPAIQQAATTADQSSDFRQQFDAMHAATRRTAAVARAVRQARLDALFDLVHDNGDRFVEAIAADFGHRSAHETRLLELFPSLEAIRHTRSHFGGWMKPQGKAPSLWFRPGRARILMQPLGVVGIIVPWNYPLFLAISPMAAALAAGNRVMVKMSEFTPRTGELLASLATRYFSPDDVSVVLGDATVGADFARLPFDHLLFTGSTKVGHDIIRRPPRPSVPRSPASAPSPIPAAQTPPRPPSMARHSAGARWNVPPRCSPPPTALSARCESSPARWPAPAPDAAASPPADPSSAQSHPPRPRRPLQTGTAPRASPAHGPQQNLGAVHFCLFSGGNTTASPARTPYVGPIVR